MILSSKEEKGEEEMGIENPILNKKVYKGTQLYRHTKGGQREQSQENMKEQHRKFLPLSPKRVSTQPISAPISETRFIHNKSMPLSLKHVSYTADQ